MDEEAEVDAAETVVEGESSVEAAMEELEEEWRGSSATKDGTGSTTMLDAREGCVPVPGAVPGAVGVEPTLRRCGLTDEGDMAGPAAIAAAVGVRALKGKVKAPRPSRGIDEPDPSSEVRRERTTCTRSCSLRSQHKNTRRRSANERVSQQNKKQNKTNAKAKVHTAPAPFALLWPRAWRGRVRVPSAQRVRSECAVRRVGAH